MSFYIVIDWNPANEIPFGIRQYLSKPYPTREKAWGYVQRVQERAKLSGVQLHDIAVFTFKPKELSGWDADHDKLLVHDYAKWRLHGRKTSYRAEFC